MSMPYLKVIIPVYDSIKHHLQERQLSLCTLRTEIAQRVNILQEQKALLTAQKVNIPVATAQY
jgi:hypothetical protein